MMISLQPPPPKQLSAATSRSACRTVSGACSTSDPSSPGHCLTPGALAGRFVKAFLRHFQAMMRHDIGWYVVDRLVFLAEGAELLPVAGTVLASQFDHATVARFSNMSCRLVDKLVRAPLLAWCA